MKHLFAYWSLTLLSVFFYAKNTHAQLNQFERFALFVASDDPDSSKLAIGYLRAKDLLNKNPYLSFQYAKITSRIALHQKDSLYYGLLNAQFGSYYNTIGKTDSALYFYNKNLIIQSARKDVQRVAKAHFQLSNINAQVGNHFRSIHHLKEGINQLLLLNDNNSILPVYYAALGSTYTKVDLTDSAIYWYNRAMITNQKKGNFDQLAKNYDQLGDLYSQKKEFHNAEKALNEALKLKFVLSDTTSAITTSLLQFDNYFQQNDLKKAKKTLQSIDQLRAVKSIELNQRIIKRKIKLYQKEGVNDSALYYALSLINTDRIVNHTQTDSLTTLTQLVVETIQSEQKNSKDLLNQNTKLIQENKQLKLFVILALLLSVLILIGFLLYLYKKIRALKGKQEKQINELEISRISALNDAELQNKITTSEITTQLHLYHLLLHQQVKSLSQLGTNLIGDRESFAEIKKMLKRITSIQQYQDQATYETHFDINQLIRHLTENLNLIASDKAVQLVTKFGEATNAKIIDNKKVKRLLERIIIYSINRSNGYSTIEIRTEKLSAGLTIEIINQADLPGVEGRIKIMELIKNPGISDDDKFDFILIDKYCRELDIKLILDHKKRAGTTFQLYLSD